jgi:AmmeMemoRadiSam system protein B
MTGFLKQLLFLMRDMFIQGRWRLLRTNLVRDYEKVILLGPSHTVYLDGVVSDTHRFWETPLGKVSVMKKDFEKNEEAHANEHCLEVQVPFLQFVLKKFEILPLVVGEADVKTVSEKCKNFR